jgi:hypothetical protein
MCASFSVIEKKKKVGKLLDTLLEIEGDLHLAMAKTSLKDSVRKFFKVKTFGTFEQMRVEMELRYKAKQVFLNTLDKTILHGYWVPCLEA